VAADALLTEVVETYVTHPIRHQARYSRLSVENWVVGRNPFLESAPLPQPGIDFPVSSPFEAVRERRIREMHEDPRFLWSASGVPLVRIPAGVFIMGGQPALFPRELPLREVTISKPFLMSAWPVTRGLWRQFRPEAVPAPADILADEVPIAQISREDALSFCEFLTERDGLSYRLPTEAEWEYAARGGIVGAPHPWGHQSPDNSLCNWEDSFGVPVASYPANDYGLFEMVGNTREWTSDLYLDDAYARTPYQVTDPRVEDDPRITRDRHDASSLYCLRGGVNGLPYCKHMMRCALRLTGREASIRLVVSQDG
jgi:formylglycine-generating enzyme required for sulfatase activity